MTNKEQILNSAKTWIEQKVDAIVSANPRLNYIKPNIRNYIDNIFSKYEDKLDNAMMFITDKDGNLYVDDLFDGAMKILDEMPVETKSMFGFDLSYGKGAVELKMPNNFFMNLLVPNTGSIKLTQTDFAELKNLLSSIK